MSLRRVAVSSDNNFPVGLNENVLANIVVTGNIRRPLARCTKIGRIECPSSCISSQPGKSLLAFVV